MLYIIFNSQRIGSGRVHVCVESDLRLSCYDIWVNVIMTDIIGIVAEDITVIV